MSKYKVAVSKKIKLFSFSRLKCKYLLRNIRKKRVSQTAEGKFVLIRKECDCAKLVSNIAGKKRFVAPAACAVGRRGPGT